MQRRLGAIDAELRACKYVTRLPGSPPNCACTQTLSASATLVLRSYTNAATTVRVKPCAHRDAKASCELEVARLQQQLAERVRELDLAAERLAGCEREVAAKEDAAARKAIEVIGSRGLWAALRHGWYAPWVDTVRCTRV